MCPAPHSQSRVGAGPGLLGLLWGGVGGPVPPALHRSVHSFASRTQGLLPLVVGSALGTFEKAAPRPAPAEAVGGAGGEDPSGSGGPEEGCRRSLEGRPESARREEQKVFWAETL